MTIPLETIADALLGSQEPCIVLLDSRCEGFITPLDGAHPVEVLESLSPEVGARTEAVAMMLAGSSINLETGERGRVVIAMAIDRHGASACRLLDSNGVSVDAPAGAIPEAVAAFLGA